MLCNCVSIFAWNLFCTHENNLFQKVLQFHSTFKKVIRETWRVGRGGGTSEDLSRSYPVQPEQFSRCSSLKKPYRPATQASARVVHSINCCSPGTECTLSARRPNSKYEAGPGSLLQSVPECNTGVRDWVRLSSDSLFGSRRPVFH